MTAGTCIACRGTGPIDQHHVAGKALSPIALVSLCPPCHSNLHAASPLLWRRVPDRAGVAERARVLAARIVTTIRFVRSSDPTDNQPNPVYSLNYTPLVHMLGNLLMKGQRDSELSNAVQIALGDLHELLLLESVREFSQREAS